MLFLRVLFTAYMRDDKPMATVLNFKQGQHRFFQIYFNINYCTLVVKKYSIFGTKIDYIQN